MTQAQSLLDIFPTLYRPFLPDFFKEPAPREEKATCDNCAMVRKDGEPPAADEVSYFRPDAKCCTYQPKLPSYLVGAILSDARPDMAEGARRIRARIAQRIGVTPRWLSPSRKTSVLYNASRKASFGRSLVLRCPYFEPEGGLCTIWRNRESICSTFFCKYSAGADGEAFWKSLVTYLSTLETLLSGHAQRAVGPRLVEPTSPVGEMSLHELEDRPPPAADYSAMWVDWEGREEEYYIKCYETVAALTQAELDAIIAAHDQAGNAAARLRAAMDAYRVVSAPTLPERLMANPQMGEKEVEAGVLVQTYSRYEPTLLTRDLRDVVRAFDGASTVAETRAKLEREMGVDIPEGMLIALHQLRILIPPAVAPPPA